MAEGFTSAFSSQFDVTPNTASSLSFTGQPTGGDGTQDACASVTVTAYTALGNVATGHSTNVQISLAVLTGTGTMTSQSATPSSGVASSFPTCTVQGDGTFKLMASSGSLETAFSDTFTITAVVSTMAFENPPTSMYTGSSTPFVVDVIATHGGGYTGSETFSAAVVSGSGAISVSGATNNDGKVSMNISLDEQGSHTIRPTCNSCGVTGSNASVTVLSNGIVKIRSLEDVYEGQTNTYEISLSGKTPSGNVNVAVSSTSPTVTITTTSLVFSAVNDWKQVQFDLDANDTAGDSYTVTIQHTFTSTDAEYDSNPDFEDCRFDATGLLTLEIADRTAEIQVDTEVDIEEGSSALVTVTISQRPQSTVTVTPSSAEALVTVSPSSVDFTASDYSPKQFTLTAGSISTGDLSQVVQVTYAVSGDSAYSSPIEFPSSLQTNAIVVRSILSSFVVTGDFLNLAEGESGTYTIRLSSQPTNSVDVTLSSSDAKVTVSPTSHTFSTSSFGDTTVTVEVVAGPSTLTSTFYTATISHSLSSSDANYNGLTHDASVTVVNVCKPAVYDWINASTCSTDVSFFTGDPPEACEPGTHYSGSACVDCSAGSYCPDGKSEISCPNGYYTTTTGQSVCEKSPPGTVYVDASTEPTAVSGGQYTPSGAAGALSCAIGDFCPYPDVLISFKCTLGSYTSSTGQSSCTVCPEGKECTYSGESSCSHYSPEGSYECFECSYDVVCSSDERTPLVEGQYMSSSTAQSCPIGSYCSVRNNFIQTDCPSGTTGPTSTGGSTCTLCSGAQKCLSDTATSNCPTPSYDWGVMCLDCPYPLFEDSSTCNIPAAGSSTPTACSNGEYSSVGDQLCRECSPGFKCTSAKDKPTGADAATAAEIVGRDHTVAASECPARTFSELTGKMDITECKPCLPGFTCGPATSIVPLAGPCPGDNCAQLEYNLFCPMGCNTGDSANCPPGSKGSQGSGSMGDCNICGSGSYCKAGAGQTAVWDGEYSYDKKTSNYCPVGTYLNTAGTDITNCLDCLSDYECLGGERIPTSCLLGWRSTATDINCERCPVKKVCPGSGITPLDCKDGHFCPLGTYDQETFQCPAGFYYTGTDAESSLQCVECSAGISCSSASTADSGTDCAAGFYCLAGSPLENYFACPSGTELAGPANTNTAESDCVQCSTGTSCMLGTGTAEACGAGHYCPLGTERPDEYPCAKGSYTSATNLTQQSECTTCDAGHFCIEASQAPLPCPEGTFRVSQGGESVDDCTPCTAGNFCGSENLTSVTQCGVGNYCNEGATAAIQCYQGYLCATSTMTETDMLASPCTGGHLCGTGTSVTDSSNECAAGYYCVEGTLFAEPCIPGTFRADPAASAEADCLPIPQGNYGDSFALTSGTANSCLAGYYCPEGSTQPLPCPPGTFYATTGASSKDDCGKCTAGHYCPFEAMSTPTACPDGFYCVEGSTTPEPCPTGTYDPVGGTALTLETECTDCDAGKFCDEPGLTAIKGDCEAGFFCSGRSITATPVAQIYGDLCAAGYYCPKGNSIQVPCDPGTFNSYVGSESDANCISCPAGFYCSDASGGEPTGPCKAGYFCIGEETQEDPNPATTGNYAPEGSPAELPCPKGTYQDEAAQATCKDCPVGKYCDSTGLSSATDCPEGYYCPLNTVDPIPCPPGTFRATTNAESLSDCTLCTGGKYCGTYALTAVSGDCAAGYFCTSGSPYEKPLTRVTGASSYGPCPKGHWCELGTDTELKNPCSQGFYNPSEFGTQSSDCLSCTPGRYCDSTGMDNDNAVCNANYYCPKESISGTANACTAGNYCPAGSHMEIPCEPGTYQDEAAKDTCKTCSAGFVCGRGSDNTTTPCAAGHYCSGGTTYWDQQYPCPAGTFNTNTDSSDDSDCLSCTAGKFCEFLGTGDISASSFDCEAGFYCSGGATVAKPSRSGLGGGACVQGEFCPSNSSAATSCTAGSYCGKSQLSAVSGQCTEGYTCNAGSKIPRPNETDLSLAGGEMCPEGHYCIAGSSTAAICSDGSYQPYKGAVASSECITCPPGYTCPTPAGIITPVKCPAGSYCVNGVATACTAGHKCPEGAHEEIRCPAGTYQNGTGESDCIACSAGKYCAADADGTPGATGETDCPAGYYCLASTPYANRYPCPPGTYRETPGAGTLAECLSCPGGKYCEHPATDNDDSECSGGYYCTGGAIIPKPIDSSTGGVCENSFFCPQGSSSRTNCTQGKYCDREELAAETGDCYNGFYCNASSTTPIPTGSEGSICQAGTYCAAGASGETDCPSGDYSESIGLEAEAGCNQCPLGKYCDVTGLSSPAGDCDPGFYCPLGSTVSNPPGQECTIGNFCEAGTRLMVPCLMGSYQDDTGQSTCKNCSAGSSCAEGSASLGSCANGHYCPENTRFATEFPCEAGTYSNADNLSACLSCTAGNYCPPGSVDTSNVCPQFSYCPADSGYPLLCELGRFNSAGTGLGANADCTLCPVGKYCVDGRETGECAAGYYCIEGSPTPTPTGDSITYGQQCPQGNWCAKGTTEPVECESGKFRKLVGGRRASDCTACPPGFYCEPTSTEPIDCPLGSFCIQGVDEPEACPTKTYGQYTNAESDETCTVCPAGYKCTATGIADYTAYPCNTPGSYCVAGALTTIVCPPGTYSTSTTAGAVTDCISCPAGYYCPEGTSTTTNNKCPLGTYCPLGAPEPRPCKIGYYCNEGTGDPVICPAGYYCPKYNLTDTTIYTNNTAILPPIICPENTICPEGSFFYTYCRAGHEPISNICTQCKAGYYNDGNFPTCQVCKEGYICVLGATREDPPNIDDFGGYECPAGNYCPSGATSPTPCAAGEYNPLTGQGTIAACLPCAIDTYAPTTGNTRCLPCGPNAEADIRSITCTCKGANRNYQESDGSCRCFPHYEFYFDGKMLQEEDSDIDCMPMVFEFCTQYQIRGSDGKCYEEDDCSGECTSGGSRLPGCGICECDGTKSIDDSCNNECRTNAWRATLSSTGVTLTDPSTSETVVVNLEGSEGYYGSTSCTTDCSLWSMDMNTGNGPTAVIGLGTTLNNLYNEASGRRLQTSVSLASANITNPVACIQIGETMVFSIDGREHYPVYEKDSLLNTNSDFDYGAFKELERMIESGQTVISTFAFTFTESGIYHFTDKANSDSHMIVAVMGSGEQCLDQDIQFRPRTKSSLLTLGTKTDTSIITDPDWIFILVSFLFFLLLIGILIILIYYFHRSAWRYAKVTTVHYREANKVADISTMSIPPKAKEVVVERSADKLKPTDVQMAAEVDLTEEMANDDIDPSIFQEMYKRLQEQEQLSRRNQEGNEARAREMDKLRRKLLKLKDFLRDALGRINESDDSELSDPEMNDEVHAAKELDQALSDMTQKFMQEAQLSTDAQKAALYDRIVNDPSLSKKDKDDLIADFNTNVQRIESNLENDRSKAQDTLNKRLLERAARRRAAERESLEAETPVLLSAQSVPIADPELQEEMERVTEVIQAKFNQKREEMEARFQEQQMQARTEEEVAGIRRAYEENERNLNDNLRRELEQQHADLLARRRARQDGRRRRETKRKPTLTPQYYSPEDEGKEEQLEKQHKNELRDLVHKQQQEVQEQLDVIHEEDEEVEPFSLVEQTPLIEQANQPVEQGQELNAEREAERARLEKALQTASGQEEKKAIMDQLGALGRSMQAATSDQQQKLNARLAARREQRAKKEAELQRKHAEEVAALQQRQEAEAEAVRGQITEERIQELVNSDLPPDEIAAQIKEMLDDKHEKELAAMNAKKQAEITARQTKVLQDALAHKAQELSKTRQMFREKRDQLEKSSLPEDNKLRELALLEKKETEALQAADQRFVNNLVRQQDEALRDVEGEYREKCLQLADNHLQDTAKILEKLRAADPNLLREHMRRAEEEANELRQNIQQDYDGRLADLDNRRKQLAEIQNEQEDEINKLQNELDDAEKKKRELATIEELRKEMAEKQKQMIDEMKKRGISPEQMEEMIKKHQQEMTEWEETMEKERQRQRALLEKQLEERSRRIQDKIAQKYAKYKEDNMKIMQPKEEEKLFMKFPLERPLRLHEPMHDIQSRLRVKPLPVVHKTPVREFADHSLTLQTLLSRTKRIEKIVANVDANQFQNVMDSIGHISKVIDSLK